MAIFASIYSGPPRHYGNTRTDKRYVAIHNTSNDATAEGEASYARRREDTVSSHYYVDDNSLLQSLDTDLRAYHAGSTIGNSQAIAYEITGTNGKSRTWWLANVAWSLLARQIAADCREHAIEPRLLTVAEIKAGTKTGIITHDQMRQAWGGTTHTDPGANFPLDHLLALVRAELNGDDVAITKDDAVLIAKTLLNYPLGSSGPTVGTALQSTAALLASLTPRLDAILAAALDDGDVTVVLGPEALAELQSLRAAVAAVPDAVLDAEAARLQA